MGSVDDAQRVLGAVITSVCAAGSQKASSRKARGGEAVYLTTYLMTQLIYI